MQVSVRSLSHALRVAFNKVTVKVESKVGYVEMNSERDFNALSTQMKAGLVGAIRSFETSSDVKVIVLSSSVKKAFCAGANIKDFEGKTHKDFIGNDIFKELHDTFYSAKKPIIAAVNGVALGGGFEMALLCDMIFCSEEARFALPELKLGLIPGIGGTQRYRWTYLRLARIVGRVNAMRYVLTSDFIHAAKAKELGVVCEVFPFDNLKTQVVKVAQQITQKPLSAILAAKEVIKQSQNLSMSDGVEYERKLFYPLYDTPGAKEGVNAFIEKRAANLFDL